MIPFHTSSAAHENLVFEPNIARNNDVAATVVIEIVCCNSLVSAVVIGSTGSCISRNRM